MLVPTESIIPELNGKKVFIVKNGKINPISVTTGIRKVDRIQVLSGINPGDTVVTTGILQVQPGMAVDVNIL